jgi:hypothetical protein
MSAHDKDKLEQDLDALQRKYRATARDEPPAMLDQAVLNRARRAAEQHAIRPWSFSWMHATATAALVVLGLTLVLQLRESAQAPETLPETPLQPSEYYDGAVEQDSAVGEQESFRQSRDDALFRALELQKSETLREVREEVLEPPPAAPKPSYNMMKGLPKYETQDAAVARPPEEWLDHILELKRSGDEVAWRAELEAFVRTFPEHPLPKELSEALRAEPALVPDGE